MTMLTAARVRELLDYSPATGVFLWRVGLSNGAQAGTVAGTIYKNGYVYITIDRKRYFASRLAWLHFYGEWPPAQVDHRNLNRIDNRIENLRSATNQLNAANRHVLKRNALGVKGVVAVRNVRKAPRFRARIRVNGELIHLGYFETPALANAAYAAAAVKHFGEFARTA